VSLQVSRAGDGSHFVFCGFGELGLPLIGGQKRKLLSAYALTGAIPQAASPAEARLDPAPTLSYRRPRQNRCLCSSQCLCTNLDNALPS
jgi:hypothetical protein